MQDLEVAVRGGDVADRQHRLRLVSLDVSGDAGEGAVNVRRRRDQGARIVVARCMEELARRAFLDDAPVLHDHGLVGEVGDYGEVMADIERRDPVRAAKPGRRFQRR